MIASRLKGNQIFKSNFSSQKESSEEVQNEINEEDQKFLVMNESFKQYIENSEKILKEKEEREAEIKKKARQEKK